jgi:hypothetical protein
MDVIVQIFTSLGVDHSFYYQLSIILFFLISFYFLFVDRLRTILINRKKNTVGAEDVTSEVLNIAIANEEKFQKSIQDKLNLVNVKYNDERSKVNKVNDSKFKDSESRFQLQYQSGMQVIEGEYHAARTKLGSEIEELSQKLLEKIKSGK